MSTLEDTEMEMKPKKRRRRKTGNSAIIAYLAVRRAELRMSQTQLAERAGIDRGTLSGIEAGFVSPHRTTLAKLAPALGTTYEALDRIMRGKSPQEGPDYEATFLAKSILSLGQEDKDMIRSMIDAMLFKQSLNLSRD